jgi:hypothetical protein
MENGHAGTMYPNKGILGVIRPNLINVNLFCELPAVIDQFWKHRSEKHLEEGTAFILVVFGNTS